MYFPQEIIGISLQSKRDVGQWESAGENEKHEIEE